MVTWTGAWCLSFHVKQHQSSSTFQNEEPRCRKTEFFFCRNKSTLIRPPLGAEILRACVERCVLEFFFFVSVCTCSCCLVWWIKLWGVCLSLSLSLSPSVASLCFGAKPPGHTCDTNRHQTRHCTQTKADVGRDVLFQYNACCFPSAGGYAPQADINQPLCVPACSESERLEEDRDTCSASP